MLDSKLSGPWNPEMYSEHLPEPVAFDAGLMKSLLDFYKPSKSLDLGCGLGYFVAYLRNQGVDAWGIEAEELGDLFKSPGHQIKKDLSEPFNLKEKYDLVICLEVVEHIPREFENIVFDNIVRHMSRYLLFSGATVGQQGTGHINERHEKHWFSHLVQRGLVLRHQESLNLRLSCTLPWYVNNVSIWELAHFEAKETADIIADRDSRIISYETKLQNQLRQIEAKSEQLQLELQQKSVKLSQALTQLITFRYSRFWKLHQTWLSLEKAYGQMLTTYKGIFENKPDYCKFIILGKGRSGSNFLRGLLNSHTQIITFGELFRDYNHIGWEFPDFEKHFESKELVELMQNHPTKFLEDFVFKAFPKEIDFEKYLQSKRMAALIQNHPTHFLERIIFKKRLSRVLAVGFKLFYYHAKLDSRQVIWDMLRERKDIKVIHLKRHNTLREILSLKKAFKTNRWTNITGNEEENFSIFLDYEECLREFTYAQQAKEEYELLFQEHSVLELVYEDLSNDYQGEMKRVQEFLGVVPEPVQPLTYKQSNQALPEAISNYFELKKKFKGTAWAEYFEE